MTMRRVSGGDRSEPARADGQNRSKLAKKVLPLEGPRPSQHLTPRLVSSPIMRFDKDPRTARGRGESRMFIIITISFLHFSKMKGSQPDDRPNRPEIPAGSIRTGFDPKRGSEALIDSHGNLELTLSVN